MHSYRITFALLVCLVFTATVEGEIQRLVDLFKVGQSASFTKSDRRTFSITIYTKDKKLDILARYKERLDAYSMAKEEVDRLYTRMDDIIQQRKSANADDKKRLEAEYNEVSRLRKKAREAVGVLPQKPDLHRVTMVGTDFVGLATDGDRTQIIPVAFIEELILEDVRR